MIKDLQTFLWEEAPERESLFSVLHKVAFFDLFAWPIFLVQCYFSGICYYKVILSYFEKETN